MAKKRRHKVGMRPRPQKPPSEAQASAISEMEALPTFALVATMDAIKDVLLRRGQPIRDWDEKDRAIQKFSFLGGKVYALAPRHSPMEVQANDDDGDHKSGG